MSKYPSSDRQWNDANDFNKVTTILVSRSNSIKISRPGTVLLSTGAVLWASPSNGAGNMATAQCTGTLGDAWTCPCSWNCGALETDAPQR